MSIFSNISPIIATSSAAVIGLLSWRGLQQKKYSSLRMLPSPPEHWLLGNAPQLLAAAKEQKFFSCLSNWAKELGPMYVFWVAGQPTVILSKPKVIEEVLTRRPKELTLVRSPRLRKLWKDLFDGSTIIQQEGEEWQWRRQTFTQSLTSTHLNAYLEIICLGCTQVISNLKDAAVQQKVVEVDPIFARLTMRLISCFLLGIPLEKESSRDEMPPLEKDKLYEAFVILTQQFLAEAAGEKQWLKYLPTSSSNSYWTAKNYLHDFISPRVDLALQVAGRKQQNTSVAASPLFEKSMLVHLAKQPKFTEQMLCSEAKLMLFAGTDTTAHTLSFSVGALGLNPHAFQKARQEVDEVFQVHQEINSKSLKQLTYIQAVIKETMRLYPVSNGSTGCLAIRDTVIEGIHIPKGTQITWSIMAAGRDAEEYPRPNEFLPERWLKDEQENTKPLTMLVFGSGAHRCIGESLAMLEATVMLAMLLRYFDWELVNGRASLEQLGQNLTVFPEDRMPVRFKVREVL
jgi:unspecific monooxygenase